MPNGMWIIGDEGQEEYLTPNEIEEGERAEIRPIAGLVYPADRFMALPLTRYPFYVQEWLPKRGKALMYAPAKAGKTTLALQMARCIGAGEPFLGLPTTQGKVLYLGFELGHELLQRYLTRTGQGYENVFVGVSFNLKLDETAGRKILEQVMEAITPNVLILDPLYKIMSGDENEAQDMKKITDYLDTLIEAYGCSVFLLHHSGKDVSRGGRGSSLIEGWVDSYLEMKERQHNPLKVAVRSVRLRHGEIPDKPIELEMVNFEFEQHGAVLTIADKVAAYFIENAGQVIRTGSLYAQAWGSNRMIDRALTAMVESGEIEQLSRGKYQAAHAQAEAD